MLYPRGLLSRSIHATIASCLLHKWKTRIPFVSRETSYNTLSGLRIKIARLVEGKKVSVGNVPSTSLDTSRILQRRVV